MVEDQTEEINRVSESLAAMRPKLKAEEINAEEFEKDDAANGHM